MRAINTKFGTIYIETLEYDRHCPEMREEEDRIKIFDSREEYMDSWSMEIIQDHCKDEGKTEQEAYQELIDYYMNIDDINNICPDIRFTTDDVVKFALFLKTDGGLDIPDRYLIDMIFNNDLNGLDKLVLRNEWVNKVGNHYLLIEEY